MSGSQRGLIPLPIPPMVRDAYLWCALLAVLLTFPLFAAYAGLWAMLSPLISRLTGLNLDPPLVMGLLLALMTAIGPPMLMAGSRASTFILECVKWYLDHGEKEKAKKVARIWDYDVWYREWKRNPWFRIFASESGLLEESARFRKFARRRSAGSRRSMQE